MYEIVVVGFIGVAVGAFISLLSILVGVAVATRIKTGSPVAANSILADVGRSIGGGPSLKVDTLGSDLIDGEPKASVDRCQL
jgi:hypothetical protein